MERAELSKGKALPVRHPWSGFDITFNHGIIMVSGRDRGKPIPILGKQSKLAKLWLLHVHANLLLHTGGHRSLLATARRKIWIVGCVALARAVVRTCVDCKKVEPSSYKPKEGPLPAARIGKAHAQGIFSHVLVDHCGPFLTRQGRGRAAEKRWVFIITCAATRAVHFELVRHRNVEETAAAMVRFAARYGVPAQVVSDNAPELIAAGAALRRSAASLVDPGSARTWAGLSWETYPAYAPHFGGAVESIVKLCKRALAKLIKDKEVHDLEFSHQLTCAAFLINGRPLGALSDHLADPVPLSCNDLLSVGSSELALYGPVGGADASKVYFNRLAELSERWKEALASLSPELKERTVWRGDGEQPEEGDVVVVFDGPHLPHSPFSLGVVEAVKRGTDGIARRADVRIRGKKYHRAIRSLAPLVRGEKKEKQE